MRLHQQFAGDGLEVVYIGAIETDESCRAWKEEFGLEFPVVSDGEGELFRALTNGWVPWSVLVAGLTCFEPDLAGGGQRGDDPELLRHLRIEDRELEAGELNRPEAAAPVTLTTNERAALSVCPDVPGAVRRVGVAPALWGVCRGPLQADGKADVQPPAARGRRVTRASPHTS